MKKIFSVILTLLTFISYSQSINTNTKNEVTALKNYHGGFNVDLIIDYELINDNWVKQKTDKGFIFYGGDSIYIKSMLSIVVVLILRSCIYAEPKQKIKRNTPFLIDDIFAYINNHITEEISLDCLEREFYVSFSSRHYC